MKKEIKSYFNIHHEIASASHWISLATGETFKLNAECKILWSYMIDRYQFFSGREEHWFDNQDELAAAVGISVSTVGRFIKMLEKHGYLSITKLQLRGFLKSNSYVIKTDLVVVNENNKASIKPLVVDAASSSLAPVVDDLNVYTQLDDDVIGHLYEAAPDDLYSDIYVAEDYDDSSDSTASNSSSMPKRRYTPAGNLSDEMVSWFYANGYGVISKTACAVSKNGKTYLLQSGVLIEGKYAQIEQDIEESIF